MAKLELVPMGWREANEYIVSNHRHHGAIQGHKFSLGAAKDGQLVGVIVVGRPVSRHRDDGLTLEVTRLCTMGERNVCSFLYGAAARAAFALGYRRIGTYILKSETGVSLRAAGWRLIGERGGGSWDKPSRRRNQTAPVEQKLLWESEA